MNTLHTENSDGSASDELWTPEEVMGWPEKFLVGAVCVAALICAVLPVFA